MAQAEPVDLILFAAGGRLETDEILRYASAYGQGTRDTARRS